MARGYLCFWIVVAIGGASAVYITCPTFSCESLVPNVCARQMTPGIISMNQSPCDVNFYCSYSDIANWINSPANATALPCAMGKQVTLVKTWACGTRESNKNLATGTYPKSCLSANDCLLQDGSMGECVCTLRTSSTSAYCRPHPSSDLFQDYWTLCVSNSNQISGDFQGYYWYLRTQYAILYDSAALPTCSSNLWEFTEMTRVKTQLATAAGLMVAAVGLIA